MLCFRFNQSGPASAIARAVTPSCVHLVCIGGQVLHSPRLRSVVVEGIGRETHWHRISGWLIGGSVKVSPPQMRYKEAVGFLQTKAVALGGDMRSPELVPPASYVFCENIGKVACHFSFGASGMEIGLHQWQVGALQVSLGRSVKSSGLITRPTGARWSSG